MPGSLLKRAAVSVATIPPFPSVLGRVLQRGPVIFALHRFENRDQGIPGHPAAPLRDSLALVRRLGYRTLSIGEMIHRWTNGTLPVRSVCFTVDDGFRDFITHGAPIFREFDVPVTLFAATGFVDGGYWFWWDKIEYMLARTTRSALAVDVGGSAQTYAWTNAAERREAYIALIMYLKRHAAPEQLRVLAAAAACLEVPLPDAAPESYAAMAWSDVNALASSGVTVGPHSVNHPNLARASDDESRFEITESWRRVRDAATAPVPVFCYPFGVVTSYGNREERYVREADLSGAVTLPLYGTIPDLSPRPPALPRHRFLDDTFLFTQQTLGIELFKNRLRRRIAIATTGSAPPLDDTGAI